MSDALTLHKSARIIGCSLDSPPVAYLLGLAPSSRETQAYALRAAAAAFNAELAAVDWSSIDYPQMLALRAHVASHFAPTTANRILTAVRGVLLVCVRTGKMQRDHYATLAELAPVKGTREPRGRALDPEELAALFRRCARIPRPLGARHAATVALAYGCGLRRAEVVSLTLDRYDARDRTVRVRGKGNKERLMPIPEGSFDAIESWLDVRGREPGFLLCAWIPTRGGRRLELHRRLNPTVVYETFQVLARGARIARFSPHDLRRTYVGDLLDVGVDLATVQQLAGHSDPATTSRYDRRPARARAAAVARLSVPFSSK